MTTAKFDFWTGGIEGQNWISSVLFIENGGGGARSKKLGQKESVEFFPDCFAAVKFNGSLFLKGLAVFRNMRTKNRELHDAILSQEKQKVTSRRNSARSMVWRFRTYSGLGKLFFLFEKIRVQSDDVFILWGQHLSVHRVVADWARAAGAKVIFTEGTELQGSVFASERGILHHSWPRDLAKLFGSLPISSESVASAELYLKNLGEERFSNKSYDGDLVPWDEICGSGEPLVYVNGLENFASGLRPRCSEVSKQICPEFGSNRELLERVLELADKFGWRVIYKDHPNTFQFNSGLLVKSIVHPRLWILKNVDIHEVMDRADAMVSLCSKVVLLSLSRGVPVVLGGAFSVSPESLEYGLKEDFQLEAGLLEVLSRKRGERVDRKSLVQLTARIIEHYAYRLPAAQWSSSKDNVSVWSDICAYLNGERSVISTDLSQSKAS